MQGEISAGGLIIGGIIGQRGAPGNGIVSITLTGTSGLEDTYTILYTNGDTDTFVVTNGATGNGIVSITKTSSVGLVDTYTILYTNGSSDTIEVHNGEKGDKGDKGDTGLTPNLTIGSVTKGASASATITGTTDNPVLNLVLPKGDKGDKGDTGNTGATGVGIYSITKTGTADLVDTYTILYTNGDTQTYTITNGAKGDTGATGNGISTITKTGTAGLVDTYTITFTNGNTTTFDVTNGADGNVTDVQVEGTSVVDNGVANITGLATQEELDRYKTIYNVLPKVTDTDEAITLNNTGNAWLDLELKGNTSQYTTTGKQLLNEANIAVAAAGAGIKYNGSYIYDNSPTSDTRGWGYSTSNYYITLNAGTYTMALIFKKKITNSNGGIFRFFKTDDTFVGNINAYNVDNAIVSFTLSETTNLGLYFKLFDGELNIMLVEGSYTSETMPSYEPYTNGASPNPDYPQPINVVSGDNEITIANSDNTQSQTYPIYLGVENLFDKSTMVLSSANINTGTNKIASLSSSTTIYIPCKPSTTYTISKILTSRFVWGTTQSQPAVDVSVEDIGQDNNLTQKTITTNANAKYIVVWLYTTTYDTTPLQDVLDSIQIEVGSKKNSYTPYGTTPIELCKIGDYQDYFTKNSSGQWCKYNAIGKVVWTGANTESWTLNPGISNTFVIARPNDLQSGDNDVFYNYFKTVADLSTAIEGARIGGYINLKNKDISTIENFRTWLGTHNTEMYYKSTTPYLSLIEDTTLINQLDNIQNAMSYEGQTNVSQVNNDKPFIIDGTALRSLLDYGNGE